MLDEAVLDEAVLTEAVMNEAVMNEALTKEAVTNEAVMVFEDFNGSAIRQTQDLSYPSLFSLTGLWC